MKNNAFLSNAGHFNVEVDCEALADMAVRVYPQNGIFHEAMSWRTATLNTAGRGPPGESGLRQRPTPRPRSWTRASLSVQALALGICCTTPPSWARQVYDIPEEIDREVSRLKLHGAGLRIDTLTPEQEAYLSGWQV